MYYNDYFLKMIIFEFCVLKDIAEFYLQRIFAVQGIILRSGPWSIFKNIHEVIRKKSITIFIKFQTLSLQWSLNSKIW